MKYYAILFKIIIHTTQYHKKIIYLSISKIYNFMIIYYGYILCNHNIRI